MMMSPGRGSPTGESVPEKAHLCAAKGEPVPVKAHLWAFCFLQKLTFGVLISRRCSRIGLLFPVEAHHSSYRSLQKITCRCFAPRKGSPLGPRSLKNLTCQPSVPVEAHLWVSVPVEAHLWVLCLP